MILCLLLSATLAGCRTASYAERGAVTGGLVGGLTGAALGSHSGNAGEGAFWGGAVGSLVGATMGDNIDAEVAEREAIAARQAALRNGPHPVSVDEVAAMVQSGVGEQVVINHVRTHGLASPLNANDIMRLHQQGISDNIIAAMQNTAVRGATVPGTGPPPVIVHEHVVEPIYYGPPVRYWPPRRRYAWGFSVHH